MINYIHYLFHKPENGWDPVSKNYALEYSNNCYKSIDYDLINEVTTFFCCIQNKSLVDLGAGPGQYSIEFTKLGANVTWHDVSKNYMEIAINKANDANVVIDKFILQYMDEVNYKCDFIFSRVCFYYCINDKQFLKNILNCLNKNGKAFITLHNEDFYKFKKLETFKWNQVKTSILTFLNNSIGLKIGHPHMSKKRIEKLFNSFELNYVNIYHDSLGTTTIKLVK